MLGIAIHILAEREIVAVPAYPCQCRVGVYSPGIRPCVLKLLTPSIQPGLFFFSEIGFSAPWLTIFAASHSVVVGRVGFVDINKHCHFFPFSTHGLQKQVPKGSHEGVQDEARPPRSGRVLCIVTREHSLTHGFPDARAQRRYHRAIAQPPPGPYVAPELYVGIYRSTPLECIIPARWEPLSEGWGDGADVWGGGWGEDTETLWGPGTGERAE
ncbi:hypothetical protein B0H12DRAFT_1082785 [Mycena haematopus]|nr:hypothetical protein B0H12DRAFT_1082785 [Mycena haematopus]